MEDMDKPALCRSVNGPHVTTFDGRYAPPSTNMLIILILNRCFKCCFIIFLDNNISYFDFIFPRYYNNFNEGEFVMYKHTSFPYEVCLITYVQNVIQSE